MAYAFDIISAVIIIMMVVRGTRKGFLILMLSLMSLAVSFFAAMALSGQASELIWDNYIETATSEKIAEVLGSDTGQTSQLAKISAFSSTIPDNMTVGGLHPRQLKGVTDESGRVTYDLSHVDLSSTGAAEAIVVLTGETFEGDLTSLNLGKVTLTADDINGGEFSRVLFSKTVSRYILNRENSMKIVTRGSSDGDAGLGSKIAGVLTSLPFVSSSENAISDVIARVILALSERGAGDSTDEIAHQISETVVKPPIIPIVRQVSFVAIFVLISLVFSLVIRFTGLIGKLPLVGDAIGTINSLLGAVVGLIEGVLTIAVITVILHIIVTLTSNSAPFFNETTFGETLIYKDVYFSEFFDFLK